MKINRERFNQLFNYRRERSDHRDHRELKEIGEPRAVRDPLALEEL